MQNIRATIDIGNAYIKWIVIGYDDEHKDTILVKECHKMQWCRKWKILDSQSFRDSIDKVIDGFQKKLWWEYIEDVIIGISHPEMIVERVTEQKRILGSDIITSNDVNHLSKLINDMSHKANYEIIKILPVYRSLDDSRTEKNPEWLQAKKLSLTADIFCIPKIFYQTLTETLQSLGIHVIDIVPNIIASVEWMVDIDHKDLGTVIVDMGANQTSYAIYEEWYPLYYGVIPAWGEDVTKDISIWLQIDIKEAEKYKTWAKDDVTTNEDSALDERFLDEVMNARYEQIYEKVRDTLIRIDRDGKLPGGIYLTGQSSERYKSIPLMKNICKLATFDAKDISGNFGEVWSNKAYQNCLGLYRRSKKYHNQKSLFGGSLWSWFRSVGNRWSGIRSSIKWTFKDLF